MVIVLNRSIQEDDKERIRTFLEGRGFRIREIVGEEETIFGAVGLIPIDIREVELLPGVDRVIPITKPYKLASREFKKDDTIVDVGPLKIGGQRIVIIAGPCAVESAEQIEETAAIARASGAVMLRGGAFKPRSSPYAFQGLGEEGLRLLKIAGEKEGMPVVSEIVSVEYADKMAEYVDVLQIGTRNMQNFELLKRVGSMGKPVILKRGLAATIEDWLMAAEYLLAHGTDDVILCERGIRTFETYTRNTLDISAIPVVKTLSHLPIIVDPSHATGIRNKVPPVALASIAAGADGLIVEMHPRPEEAASDGPQSLYPEQFEKLMRDIEVLAPVVGKEIARLAPIRTDSGVSARFVSARDGTISAEDDSRHVDGAEAKSGSIGDAAYQGERGAFSEIATHRYFGRTDIKIVPCKRFRDVFDRVLSGDVAYGVVPMENSLAGSIHENYDLLLQYPDIRIVGEQKIRIIHNLIGFEGVKIGDITKAYSHPQGLAQCSSFLERYPNIEPVPYYDTAASVSYVAQENRKDWAAIASADAARVYGLSILKEGIETNPRNYTRFFVIARGEHPYPADENMASFVFATADKSGALFTCLKILADESLNMHKLESRPIPGKPWEYMFYVDVEIPDEPVRFERGVERLAAESEGFRILGRYRTYTPGA